MWRKISLSKADVLSGVNIRIMKEFVAAHDTHGRPPGSALFSTDVVTGGPHDSDAFVTLYLSPVAVMIADELIAKYTTVECEPAKRGAFLIFGAQDSVNLLD